MEILQFLISFFVKEYFGDKYAPILETFKNNSFDLKKVLSSLSPEVLTPILKDFLSGAKKESPASYNELSFGIEPIKNIADSEIVFLLNAFLSE